MPIQYSLEKREEMTVNLWDWCLKPIIWSKKKNSAAHMALLYHKLFGDWCGNFKCLVYSISFKAALSNGSLYSIPSEHLLNYCNTVGFVLLHIYSFDLPYFVIYKIEGALGMDSSSLVFHPLHIPWRILLHGSKVIMRSSQRWSSLVCLQVTQDLDPRTTHITMIESGGFGIDGPCC